MYKPQWDPNRLRIVEELRSRGVNPYPHKFEITHTISQIRELAKKYPISHDPFLKGIRTVGRVANVRRHGKASFVDIFDEGERLQLYLRVNELGDRFEEFHRYVDRGDVIGVEGDLFYTLKGELTLLVHDYALLAKALLEPPDWSKYTTEWRYTHRYLDFLYNSEARRIIQTRFRIIQAIREFLNSMGFMEVETPILQPVYGGALAKPFKTHVNALDEDWYLRISLELYLKRFIIGGFNKVYEIGKVFRNEDIDVYHNPEFTMLELYWAYADYNDIMRLTEDLIHQVAVKVTGKDMVEYPIGEGKVEVKLTTPFRRLTMYEALSNELGKNVESMSDDELRRLMNENGLVPRGGQYVRGLMIEKLFDKLVAPKLIQPTFITDYPQETTPLCKPHRSKPGLIERFELYIAGMELANAYTELNDPQLQHKFFEEEAERFKGGDEEAHPYDYDFVLALSYGMPPTGGLGIGIDRLVMVLTGQYSIKEVIPFPMVKHNP
ncbi:lysine--tRNA ligase [Caldivirga maquilingensis]|uniref:Lysine--tRNA ligase n=1 Tax=Caldivirga maquilingensis (strain ATCC 700844 / DSM 13496 / JCM 10307 / IC-167) TaxID=397948 RepID=A8ME08_CALMQ|nr:lysine--tRNA ligase [Caldivirga maquilingensis]ABW02014.1 lysyl-tRNA synthetase [Caldivirga maquilingensis IC-167]